MIYSNKITVFSWHQKRCLDRFCSFLWSSDNLGEVRINVYSPGICRCFMETQYPKKLKLYFYLNTVNLSDKIIIIKITIYFTLYKHDLKISIVKIEKKICFTYMPCAFCRFRRRNRDNHFEKIEVILLAAIQGTSCSR